MHSVSEPPQVFGKPLISVFNFLFLASCVIFGAHFLLNILQGGDEWQQGDWLINNHSETVRRGLIGSGILSLSDLMKVSPLAIVYVLQTSIFSVLMVNLYVVLRFVLQRNETNILLISSSAFFLIYWAAAPDVGLRKEVLVYLAMSFLLLWGIRRDQLLLWVSTAFFGLGVIGHEANLLIFPAFMYIFLVFTRGESKARGVLPFALILVAVAYTVWVTINHTMADPIAVCNELTSRGVPPTICDGAIAYLDTSAAEALNHYHATIEVKDLIVFPLAYVLGSLASFYLIYLSANRKRLLTLYILTALPFLPLYAIAVDWGRWMNFHISSFAFIVMALEISGQTTFDKPVSPKVLKYLIILALVISLSSGTNVIEGGVIKSFVEIFTSSWSLLTS